MLLFFLIWKQKSKTSENRVLMGSNVAFIAHHLYWHLTVLTIDRLGLRQNGCYFPGDIFKCILLNENIWISIKISMKFVSKDSINNIPTLVKIMAWCPIRWKAIIWTYDGVAYWRIYASLDPNELNWFILSTVIICYWELRKTKLHVDVEVPETQLTLCIFKKIYSNTHALF